MAHLFGLGLDCDDGHKRITKADKFSILGGSEQTHDRMTETLIKTIEDLTIKGKNLEDASSDELSDIIQKNTPSDWLLTYGFSTNARTQAKLKT